VERWTDSRRSAATGSGGLPGLREAVGGGKDGAPNMLLRHVAVADNRIDGRRSSGMTLTTIPTDESWNCFGQFGSRSNESDN